MNGRPTAFEARLKAELVAIARQGPGGTPAERPAKAAERAEVSFRALAVRFRTPLAAGAAVTATAAALLAALPGAGAAPGSAAGSRMPACLPDHSGSPPGSGGRGPEETRTKPASGSHTDRPPVRAPPAP
ncbi:hypothetical protein ACIQV2_02795 [Streptomyces globosus]|uniref:hypothetical protein n=1 Tax=Streptomyces globosus TaxID=68209 RepID=UPI0038307E2D